MDGALAPLAQAGISISSRSELARYQHRDFVLEMATALLGAAGGVALAAVRALSSAGAVHIGPQSQGRRSTSSSSSSSKNPPLLPPDSDAATAATSRKVLALAQRILSDAEADVASHHGPTASATGTSDFFGSRDHSSSLRSDSFKHSQLEALRPALPSRVLASLWLSRQACTSIMSTMDRACIACSVRWRGHPGHLVHSDGVSDSGLPAIRTDPQYWGTPLAIMQRSARSSIDSTASLLADLSASAHLEQVRGEMFGLGGQLVGRALPLGPVSKASVTFRSARAQASGEVSGMRTHEAALALNQAGGQEVLGAGWQGGEAAGGNSAGQAGVTLLSRSFVADGGDRGVGAAGGGEAGVGLDVPGLQDTTVRHPGWSTGMQQPPLRLWPPGPVGSSAQAGAVQRALLLAETRLALARASPASLPLLQEAAAHLLHHAEGVGLAEERRAALTHTRHAVRSMRRAEQARAIASRNKQSVRSPTLASDGFTGVTSASEGELGSAFRTPRSVDGFGSGKRRDLVIDFSSVGGPGLELSSRSTRLSGMMIGQTASNGSNGSGTGVHDAVPGASAKGKGWYGAPSSPESGGGGRGYGTSDDGGSAASGGKGARK